VINREDYNARG